MMKKLLVFLTLGVFSLSVVAGCDKKKDEKADEDKTEKKEEGKTEEGKTEEGKTEEGKTEEGKTEEGKTEEGKTEARGGGSACDAYAKCCNAYAEAIGKVKGVPKSAVEATKKGCAQIENLKKLPTAEATCKKAMEAMKKASAAYSKMPGFKMPDACK